MAEPDEAPLVATRLAPRRLATRLVELWDEGAAVLPLDPAAPDAEVERILTTLRPTHVEDDGERVARAGGVPVSSDIAVVVATSGTTGTPKGVELTRDGMVAGARAYVAGIGATRADRWLGCLPMHHVAGLAIVPRSVYTGIPATIHDGFDVDAVGRSPTDERTTIVLVVPTMLRRLLAGDAPIERFSQVLVGAGPLPPDLREACEARGARVRNTYGMTEAWGGVAFDGVPIPGVDLAVAESGEILVRGPLLMAGYRFEPELTAEVLVDGWYRTGDVGEIVDGVLRITDRVRDLVKTGGVTVSPTEVEDVLIRHPGVADVCVAGIADPDWGERVVAFVVPADRLDPPDLDAVRAFAAERLSPAKLPRELRLLTEIPRSTSGKALRHRLVGG